MTKTFESYSDLTSTLAFDLIDRLAGKAARAQFGMSNQSCSAYVNITAVDQDGNGLEDFKVRFSDHADRHGSDVTFRIDRVAKVTEDECGDFVGCVIEDWRFADLLDQAELAALRFIAAERTFA